MAVCPKCGRTFNAGAATIKAKCTNPACGATVILSAERKVEATRGGTR